MTTPPDGTWSREWTHWGYTPDGVRRGVDPSKHLLKQCGMTPGLNQEVFAFWVAVGVPLIRVVCTDGSIFVAKTEDLDCHPKRRGITYQEPQWGWPRAAWDILPPPDMPGQIGLWS